MTASLLLVDVETTGLDPQRDELVEIGAVLFDAGLGVPISAWSSLVRASGNAAAALNRIPPEAVQTDTLPDPEMAWTPLRMMANAGKERSGAFYCVAHNAAFDSAWLPPLEEERWICTHADAEWPRLNAGGLPAAGSGSLLALALAYDVGVVRAHRAIEDVLTLAAILSRVHELEGGLGGWIGRAIEPKREVVAMVSYDDREKAKSAGFRWEPGRKLWVRNVRASQVEAYRAGLGFPTRLA